MEISPTFSIIIVSYNAERYIGLTIESVLQQTYSDYEIVVKDGLSKDRTLEMIPSDPRITVYAEKDEGIYDAMNQAIRHAKGKYTIFLNCGDSLYDNTVLERVAESLRGKQKMCLYGDLHREGMLRKQAGHVTDYSLYRSSICHQTVFFPTEELSNGGEYDLHYSIIADHELELRLFKRGVDYLYLDYPICIYQGGGVSESAAGVEKLKHEKAELQKQYFTPAERLYFAIRYGMTLPHTRTLIKKVMKAPSLQRIYRVLVNSYYSRSK